MNTYIARIAAIPGVIAVAAIVLSLVIPFHADVVIGFAAVLAIVAMGTADYDTPRTRALGR